MAELDKNKWLSNNLYEFEKDRNGNLFVVINDTYSEIEVRKEQLPDNSMTKFLINRLKKRGKLK